MKDLTVESIAFDAPIVQTIIAEWNRELAETIPGFSPRGGSLVAATEFVPPQGVFFVARRGDEPLGCGGVRRLAARSGEVKRLYVRSAARGQGVGRALLGALEDAAVGLSLATLRMDTDGGHRAALALFRSFGYQSIADYNGNPYARYWFEKRLAP